MKFIYSKVNNIEMFTELYTDLYDVTFHYDLISETIIEIYEEMLIELGLPYSFKVDKKILEAIEELIKIKMETEKTYLEIEIYKKNNGRMTIYYKLENKLDLEQLNEEYKILLQELKLRKQVVLIYNYENSEHGNVENREYKRMDEIMQKC
jgi:hypothetical protein